MTAYREHTQSVKMVKDGILGTPKVKDTRKGFTGAWWLFSFNLSNTFPENHIKHQK